MSELEALRGLARGALDSLERSRGRIDPVIAALMARKLATADLHEPVAEDPDLVTA